MTRNLELSELANDVLTESELDKVSGGEKELSQIIGAWYEALGRLNLPLPSQGNSFTDSLNCNTQ
jgi:hypothetical protein